MLERYADAQLDALLALLKDALNAELSTAQDLAVETTHAWPIGRERLMQQQFPALVIWRQRGGFRERIAGPHDQRVTLRIQYHLPTTPLAKVGLRWPLLQAAWDTLTEVFLAGHHEAHLDDADVLTAAGFIDIDLGGATVDFMMPGPDSDVAPSFDATVTVVIRPTSSTTDLAVTSLQVDLHPEDLPADERPLVSEILEP